ncbi:hypothetical protein [Nocardioides sp. AE5]|uniref:hypothetical protein n=1 Tax=Nocardioides sp. AE5 TaxID=2962573 RepID=UPI0028815EA2|nr:hypothetical protein [Nocardioides sp. AE5]MDT0200512.1 hypothetical protein [Nocardioides sp. AE5]
MADKDLEDGPSLEMPSLGSLFQRKTKEKGKSKGKSSRSEKSKRPTAEDFDAVVRGKKAEPAPDDVPAKSAPAPAASNPAKEPAPAPQEKPKPVAAEKPAPAARQEAPAAEAEPTVIVPPVDEPSQVPDAEPPVVVEDAPAKPVEPESVAEDEVAAKPAPAAKAPAAKAPAPVAPATTPEDAPVTIFDEETDEDVADDQDAEEVAPKEPRPKREFKLPAMPQLPPLAARTAAAVTGLIIGILAVALTFGSLRGCEAVKGTSSCGTPGFFLLIAIMITLVALGSALLGAWKVTDPTSTSFLAVGLLAVIALLFLIRVLFSPWMAVVIPIVAVITYVASQWLTTLFEDEEVVPE